MDVRAAARAWMGEDPDPATRDEIDVLLALDDLAGLEERFGERLTFGTAGIRGPLGAGPARMNRALVRRVTAGLAARLLDEPRAAERGVVVGRDARHGSAEFADDACRVLAGVGIRVHRFPGPVPTPLVAFAVRHLDAAAGVQVTASHNPAGDNGYKVYWTPGAQIAAPLDTEIAAAIDAVGPLASVVLAPPGDPRVLVLDDGVRDAYLAAALTLSRDRAARSVRLAYTPLHGVGRRLFADLCWAAELTDVAVVAEQAEPDPDFPTVVFPNPEEPGAMDRLLELARDVGADVALANDPDADRVAVAVPAAGGWRVLSGDEVGCLLAEHLLAAGQGPDRWVATTVVSSRLLSAIAAHHGVAYAETLTGFKWLGRAALDARASGHEPVLAYEQALGYMVGDVVLDKDGLTGALLVAELVASLRRAGRSVQDALDDLARRHGVHATAGRSLRLDGGDDEVVTAALERMRRATDVAGAPVESVADHAAGSRTTAGGAQTPLSTPRTDLVSLELADGSRVQVRPSGTEPLLKLYVEVVEPVAAGEPVAGARARADSRLSALADAALVLAGGR